jgi:hypothetical protein
MKEEVGMKRRGPSKLLVGMAAAGLVTWLASAAVASVDQGPENVYTNVNGVNGAEGTTSNTRAAGPEVNPGGIGQVLYAGLYDVRSVPSALDPSVLEPQFTNFAILNSAPIPGNTNQGVLARIRFRESKTSQEVLDFNIVLSCGQVWVGQVFLDAAVDLPAITSPDPVVTSEPFTNPIISYSPVLAANAQRFVKPTALQNVDIQRGYFEVFAEEAIPCAPTSGDERTGTYSTAGITDDTPPNTLAATVIIVRNLTGVSYHYNATAISRFVAAGQGRITSPILSPSPNTLDCIFFDGTSDDPCVDAVDFQLAKNRVMFQWDELQATNGQSYLVTTFPTKHHHCAVSAITGDYTGAGNDLTQPPFQCGPVATSGEEVGCTLYNRIEDLVIETNIFSPGDVSRCFLPREVTFLALVENSSECVPGAPGSDPRCDIGLVYTSLPAGASGTANQNGWLDIDTFFGVHFRNNLDPNYVQLLGLGFTEYEGLPVIPMVIQEYTNGNVGGVFGGVTPAYWEVGYGSAS